MQANNILQADMLDILFEHKNKDYGAYQLRKTYNKRLLTAIGIMVGVSGLFFAGSLLAGAKKPAPGPAIEQVVTLTTVDLKKPDPVVTPPVAKPVEPVKTIKLTPPVVVPDNNVKPEDEMKEVDELDHAKIGNINNPNGIDDNGIVAPPSEVKGTGVATELKPKNDVDDIVAIVQIEAKFPGGIDAWRKYLERNLNAAIPAENGAASGSTLKVVVSFVVNRMDGSVSEVVAENDPGYGTAAEAVKVIQRGPKWTPAVQNGRNVNYRQRQVVIFKVEEE
ncbi:energy transducer TonB [Deminuibacter soli]|nr:energy transducer TonB [Deminuibacter soli]